MDEIISSETLAGSEDVALPDGHETDSHSGIKDVLSPIFGSQFKDDESALKAVKDTKDFVGEAGKYKKAVEEVRKARGFANNEQAIKYIMENVNKPDVPPVDTNHFVSKEEFNRELYYKDHPEQVPFKDVIEGLVQSTGKPREEVLQLESVKTLFDAKIAQENLEKSKSVLHSNPRLGQVTDKISQAREALQQGNELEARNSAVGAVIDAFETR